MKSIIEFVFDLANFACGLLAAAYIYQENYSAAACFAIIFYGQIITRKLSESKTKGVAGEIY